MKRIAIVAGLALTSLLLVSCSEETAEAKVKNLNVEITELSAELKDASADDKGDIEKKLKKLKKELAEAMKAVAEEAGDKLKEGVDGLLGDK